MPSDACVESASGFRKVRYVGVIPSDWAVEKIGDLFHDQLGKMLSQKSKTGTSYRPYLGNWNVQWGRFDLQRVEQMDFSPAEVKKFALKPGDLLVCEGGEVGRTAIWRGEIDGCCYQKALHRLRPRNHKMIPEFFAQFMREAVSRDLFRRYTTESSIAHLTRETLIEVQIPCPPVEEQQKIATALGAVDYAIEQTRGVIAQTRQLKTALLQDLLTHGLPGRHRQFATHKHLGTVPSEWRVVPLANLITRDRPICYGILMPGRGFPGGVPVVKVKDLVDGAIVTYGLLLTDPKLDQEYRRSRLRSGDVLISIRGTTGRVAVVPDSLFGANITQDTARLSIDCPITRDYVYYALQGRGIQGFVQHNTIGQAVKGINIGEVRRIPVPLPEEEERVAIVSMMHACEERLKTEGDKYEQLLAVKRALSQVLLTGRIRINPKF